MTEFLSYEQAVALITLITSPLYVAIYKIYDKVIKMGCDITSLKTENNIIHKNGNENDADR